jgi:hypothetical protein
MSRRQITFSIRVIDAPFVSHQLGTAGNDFFAGFEGSFSTDDMCKSTVLFINYLYKLFDIYLYYLNYFINSTHMFFIVFLWTVHIALYSGVDCSN